ncbi:MAG: hypothetical protein FWD58_10610 [Firmicutes bacterium]|nr:hypothetical protein [Bacillota bacterium]
MLKSDGFLTREALCARLEKDMRTIMRAIKVLKDNGLIERKGANKDGCWKVKG